MSNNHPCVWKTPRNPALLPSHKEALAQTLGLFVWSIEVLIEACPNRREQVVKDIRRKTRKHHSAEEKIRIVLEGLRGEESIAALCRREGIVTSLYYSWSKESLEAGKRWLAGDTARQATSPEVKELRAEASALKEAVADLTLENRLQKKMPGPSRQNASHSPAG